MTQGQCYPHHKDIRGAASLKGWSGGCEILFFRYHPRQDNASGGSCFHQIRAILSGCGRTLARPRGSMIQPPPWQTMLASHPCCSMNRRSASAPRSACRSLARCPLGRRHHRPGCQRRCKIRPRGGVKSGQAAVTGTMARALTIVLARAMAHWPLGPNDAMFFRAFVAASGQCCWRGDNSRRSFRGC